MIEALTYRMGAHTTSDDPTKYRHGGEIDYWTTRDPITRFRAYLAGRGADDAFFDEVDEAAADLAADTRRRTLELGSIPHSMIFDNVYSEPHPLMREQKAWLERYEASFATTGAGDENDGVAS
jgi:pyruvate dehydrogenase E1 component alpha subunit